MPDTATQTRITTSGARVRRRRFGLLPDGPHGWTPYAWLFYLGTFLVEPVIRLQQGVAGTGYLVATVLGIAAFLVAYFRGYWVRGRQLLPIIAFITLLGIGFAPGNIGASVMFIYAGSFAGFLDRQREAIGALALVAFCGLLTGILIDAPIWFFIAAVGITLLVGGVNLHFAQTGRANRKLRLAQEEIEHLATVAERERIARDLHDVLGHTLSLIVLKSELAARIAEQDPARAAGEMRDVETVARTTLQDVREAIRGYRTGIQDEVQRARAMLRAADIDAHFALEPVSLERAAEEALALALREAVTNVVRHSRAATCRIRIAREGADVQLDVQDDGRGDAYAEGAGLRGMRERIEATEGAVERVPDRGMHLRITVPAANAPSAASADVGRPA